MEPSEEDPLLPRDNSAINQSRDEGVVETLVVYKKRWYMLLVFGSLCCFQGALCVVWSVVAESCEAVFGWSDADISLFAMWIVLTYIVGIGPFSWLMQNKGMRVSTLFAAVLVFLGTVCRIITFTPPHVTWLAHLGNVFTGFAGPVLFSGPAVISATWFPPDQRSTATAVSAIMGVAGSALIFIIDPYVVPSPIKSHSPSTMYPQTFNFTNVSEMRQAIKYLRYSEFGVASLLLLMILVYFPSKPSTAPSVSAQTDKLAFLTGLRQLLSRQKINFWIVAIPAAMSCGVYGVFSSLLDVNLKGIGSTQTTAGWLNFYSNVASSTAGLILGRIGDKCIGRRKVFLLMMAVLSALSAFVVVLIVGQYIPYNSYALYISYISMGIGVNGVLPLYYETGIETTFPISEDVTMGVMTMLYNILPVLFLIVSQIPNIGTLWMNWFVYVSLVICVPLLAFYRERYDRLSLDDATVRSN